MKRFTMIASLIGLALYFCARRSAGQTAPDLRWSVHDANRPVPPPVKSGPAGPPVAAPSDAIILFNGNDLLLWTDEKGARPKWRVQNGYMEVVVGAGSIQTRQGFGDCQLHIEWAAPLNDSSAGQKRGNSGVLLMGRYEIQVLDGYNNRTYADGMAAAVYGQYPPLVNACRKPGEWQTFDIVFQAPRFDRNGRLAAPAHVTVVHNNVLVQNDVILTGPTEFKKRPPYVAHPAKLPLSLQEHQSPVRYRNIWIREL